MHNLKIPFSKLLLFLMIFIGSSIAHASKDHRQQVSKLVEATEEPFGIVFEIVSGDKNHLDWAVPETQRLISQLREKFPELDIAVVTHGAEQFALQKKNLKDNPGLKTKVQSLVGKGVDLHVCGTLAGWRGVNESEFSSLVDVATTGPAQINDYINLGYEKIVIRKID